MKDYKQWLVERFIIERKRFDRSGVYAYTQRAMAYNSNKIEGSTLTPEQTASLFDNGTLPQSDDYYRAKDVEEMSGHFSMFNEMLKTLNLPLSEPLIKAFHYRLKAGVFEDYANGYVAGEYKKLSNMVGNITTAKPIEVQEAMKSLLSVYNSKQTHSLMDLVKFHAAFEKIHPFQDGNGRTGRIILFRESLRANQIPIIIKDDNKHYYYQALHKAQVDQKFDELGEFFKESQAEYFTVLQDFLHVYERPQPVSIDELLKAAAAELAPGTSTDNHDDHNLDER